MRERIYRKITFFIVKAWPLILSIAAIGVFFCYPYTKSLFSNISTDLLRLLPKNYASVNTLERIREKVRVRNALTIVLESEHPEKTRELLIFLVEKLKKDPSVRDVQYKKTGYKFFDEHRLLFLELEDLETIRERVDRRIQREKLGSLYVDLEDENEKVDFDDIETKYKTRYTAGVRNEFVTDEEGKIYAMSVLPEGGSESLTEYGKFYKYIRSVIDPIEIKAFDPTMEIYYTGTIKNRLDEYQTLIKDLKLAGIVSGIGIFLLLAIYFRSPVSILTIFVPLGAGIIFSFAFAFIFIKNLNVVTSFLFAVLGGLGVEVGIHMFARYKEERVAGQNPSEAIFAILYYTGRSAITSGLTVASTFLVLIINDFKGFSEFGFITGAGIIIVYLTYHIVFPPVLLAAEKFKLLKFEILESPTIGTSESNLPFPRAILIATLVLFCVSAAGLTKTEFEYNFGNLKADIKENKIAKEKMRKTMPIVNRPAMVLIKGLPDALAVKEFVHEKVASREAVGKPRVVDTYKSWYDVVQHNQDEKFKVIREIKGLLSDNTLKLVKGEKREDIDRFIDMLNTTKPIKTSEVPEDVKNLFVAANDKEGYQISFINAKPDLELDDGRNAIAFAEEVGEMDTPRGKFYASSDSIIFADVLRTMLGEVPRVVFLSFICVFLFVLIDFRNFKKAALVMSPIVLGAVVMFGIMYLLKMKLNFYNMIVVPTVFGTSIDNSIHIYHRFEEMGKVSLLKVLKTSGGAAFLSSMTNIVGFLGLIFATHLGLASIGKLAIVGMGACLFTTLVYFPAMLQWVYVKKQV